MKDFKRLKVWEKAHALTLAIYETTARFPKTELYGLTSQLRRACASIAANIAEGCGRGSNSDFARFLQIAFGSACETEYHVLLARDLGFLSTETHEALAQQTTEVQRMLGSLIRRIRTDQRNSDRPRNTGS
jgi:four helix bundle protein